eukprot:2076872-Prymnesium_polylepis.1
MGRLSATGRPVGASQRQLATRRGAPPNRESTAAAARSRGRGPRGASPSPCRSRRPTGLSRRYGRSARTAPTPSVAELLNRGDRERQQRAVGALARKLAPQPHRCLERLDPRLRCLLRRRRRDHYRERRASDRHAVARDREGVGRAHVRCVRDRVPPIAAVDHCRLERCGAEGGHADAVAALLDPPPLLVADDHVDRRRRAFLAVPPMLARDVALVGRGAAAPQLRPPFGPVDR